MEHQTPQDTDLDATDLGDLEMDRLHRLLTSEPVPVDSAFKARVMSSLPAVGWEGRARRAWRLPVAALVMLTAGAATFAASSGATTSGASLVGALAALGQLFGTGLLASTGLLWASWQGYGLALGEVLTVGAVVAFAVLVVSLYAFLFSMISRQRRQVREAYELAGRVRDIHRLEGRPAGRDD
jgi:hypothetical protein